MKRSNVAVFVPHMGCPFRCSFCDQNSITGQTAAPTPDDVREACAKAVQSGCTPDSEIAFFGGSFTAIDRDYAASLLAAARPFVDAGRFAGIRVSTRPDFIDEDTVKFLKANRVTAVELGAQSMDDRVLLLNRRGHTAEDTRRAASLIKGAGIEFGLQMMTGLYGDSDEGAIKTAKEICALEPATVRIYPALVLRGTHLAELYESGEYAPQTLEQAVSLCKRLLTLFDAAGVRVIRLGLHASRELEQSILAGPYHPSFRELCESELFFDELSSRLGSMPAGRYEIKVNPRDLSRAAGNRKRNVERLHAAGYDCVLTGDGEIAQNHMTIRKQDD